MPRRTERQSRKADQNRRWANLNPEKVKAAKLRQRLKKYDLGPEDLKWLFDQQKGRCGICEEEGLKLAVDHNHENGLERGLLCLHCNMGLGYFKDSKRRLENAINYLAGYPAGTGIPPIESMQAATCFPNLG